jgi:hypothetical protein
MKTRRFLALVLAITVVPGPTLAGGYTYRGGYYYDAQGYAYTKQQFYQAPTYYNGCYSPGYYYTKYVYVPSAPAYAAPAVPSDWRTKLLEIAEYRDKLIGQERKAAIEQQAFMEAVGALGLRGNFRLQSYGQPVSYGQGSYLADTFQYGAHGAQGNTVYGYTYKDVASVYGDTNLNVLYQQAARLAQNAQQLGSQATGDFSGLVQQAGDNQARVAEILAKGQAAAAAMNAAGAGGRATVTRSGFSFKSTTGAEVEPIAPPQVLPDRGNRPQANGGRAAFEALAVKECATCHNPEDPKGKFDIYQYPAMDKDAKAKVVARLITTDPAKHMPQLPEGGAGRQLSKDEIALFLQN